MNVQTNERVNEYNDIIISVGGIQRGQPATALSQGWKNLGYLRKSF